MAESSYLWIGRFLMDHGYSRAAAAGIAGTIAGESGGDPESQGSGGRGLIGWTPPGKLPDSAFTGNWSHDLRAQAVQVLIYNDTNGPVDELKRQKDPLAAADLYSRAFERPAVTYSDVRPEIVQSVYKQLAGYKGGNLGTPDQLQTTQEGINAAVGSTGPGQGKQLADKSGGIWGWVAGVADDLGTAAGDLNPLKAAGEVGTAIVGLSQPFIKFAEAIDWFFVPSHWVRIISGVAGGVLVVIGLNSFRHIGGPSSANISVPLAGQMTVPEASGNMALALGIGEIGFGAVLLFVAFHNLSPEVTSPGTLAADLQGQAQTSFAASPEATAEANQ